MGSATTTAALVVVLLLSIPVLYFLVEDIVPKRQGRKAPHTIREPEGRETEPVVEDTRVEVVPEPPRPAEVVVVSEPAPKKEEPPAEKPSDVKAKAEPDAEPAPAAPSTAESAQEAELAAGTEPGNRKRPLQAILTQNVLRQLKAKFSFSDPQCNKFYSQHNQDWFVILNFLSNIKNGFYVDVGANHFQTISNTWFLDKCMGWKGICVEPNPELAGLLRAHRGCHVFNGCISSKASNLTLMIPMGRVHVAGHIVSEKNAAEPRRGDVKVASVPCLPLATLLKQQGVVHVNFMSLDVEGHEPNAIASWPTGGPPIDILTIEISTGTIQRALPQYPLLTRGMVSLVPLVGDAIMVRRTLTALHSRSKFYFPYNPYFETWWNRLCTNYEKISRAACKKLGMDFADKPRFPLLKDEAKDPLQPTFLKAMKNTTECQRMAAEATRSSAFSSRASQDWFLLNNFFKGGTGLSGAGMYLEVASGAAWGAGSNAWFLDHCLGWEGTCVVVDAGKAEEWRKHRSCQVKVPCLAKLCADLDCHAPHCPGLACDTAKDPPGCVDLSALFQSSGPLDVLALDISHAPYLAANLQWEHLRKAAIILVDGTPKTNYKLMHWPLSLRGYVLAATFAGNDVFVQRSRRLLRRRLAFPGRNSSAVQWLAGELAGYGLDAPVVDALLSHPH